MILISCFEPFGGEDINASLEVCRVLEKEELDDVHFCILPVVWREAPEALLQEVDALKPNVLLCLGQAKRRNICLEQVALNWDNFRIADNAGQQIIEKEVVQDAPKKLISTLPLHQLQKRLHEERIPSKISDSAGTFVCNHLFYTVQHALQEQEIISGFVHIPILPAQAKEDEFSMPLEEQVRAFRIIIEELTKDTNC